MSIDTRLFNAAELMQLYMHDCKHVVGKQASNQNCSLWEALGLNHCCCS